MILEHLLARRQLLKKGAIGLLALPAASSVGALAEATAVSAGPQHRLGIRDFGAKGDGAANDTAAIQEAVDRCAVSGGGEVLVPPGNYLTGAIALRSNTLLRLSEGATLLGTPNFSDYPVTQVRWEGKWIQGHTGLVYAIDASHVGIAGPGKIAGNPALGGRPNPQNPLRHPALIEFIRCNDIRLEGFSTSYRRMWSVHPTCCESISIKNLTIRSTGGNGDGIDIDSCKHVWIDGCDIATGDDCISLKSGRGSEGYRLHRPTEDVHISNCSFADSIFACIGIGSETSGGIRGVYIDRCKFTRARTFAIYIKSRAGRGAFIEDIVARNLDVSGTSGGFLRINLEHSGLRDPSPVPGIAGIPAAKNLKFYNVTVHDCPVLVEATAIDPRKPLDGFVLTNIKGTCERGIYLANIANAVIRNVDVTGYAGPLVQARNVGMAGGNAGKQKERNR